MLDLAIFVILFIVVFLVMLALLLRLFSESLKLSVLLVGFFGALALILADPVLGGLVVVTTAFGLWLISRSRSRRTSANEQGDSRG
jgi:hypothetical protein